MSKSTVVPFELPSEFSPDPLTEVIQAGARELLRTAVQAEVSGFMAVHAHLLDEDGRQRLVRHGFLPEREVMTGIGTVPVQVPRIRDRGANEDGSKIRFRSSLVPPYLRKAKSVEELLPWLYLKGISTGDFSEALAALLGPDAEGLSASTITRLKATWWDEYEACRKRDLSGKRYVYIWADGVYFTPRLDGDRQCMLVIIGTDEYGEKDVLGIMDGFRENADSWRDLLRGLQKRGLTEPPELAIGDGALGFWTALRDVYPTTREQRCWVHKTANVTGAMPKLMREKAKADLQDIWMAETKKEANAALDLFVETYGVKYERAVAKLVKDRDVLLTFYDLPAEHWKHIRTTNPIESVFATVRNRTRKTKGCLNRKTALAMVFRLMMSAKKKWRNISGPNRLPELIQGVEFKDGIKQLQNAA
jgi:transposase-like protein